MKFLERTNPRTGIRSTEDGNHRTIRPNRPTMMDECWLLGDGYAMLCSRCQGPCTGPPSIASDESRKQSEHTAEYKQKMADLQKRYDANAWKVMVTKK